MLMPGEEECPLQWVYRRSLTTTKKDIRQLRLGIEQSEREALRVAKLKRKQDNIIPRLKSAGARGIVEYPLNKIVL